MVTRILTIIAILAAIGTIVVGNVQLKKHITTIRDDRDSERTKKETAERDLKSTRSTLKTTQENLTKETDARKTAEDNFSREKNKSTALEKDKAELTSRLEKTTSDLTDTRQKLAAWDALGIPTEQVREVIEDRKRLMATVDAIEAEKKTIIRQLKIVSYELEKYRGTNEPVVIMPTGLKGKITAVDPKWDFVVLNIGEEKGVLPDGVFLVNRGGKLVGKVKVANVQRGRSVANVMNGWRLEELLEGDEVIY